MAGIKSWTRRWLMKQRSRVHIPWADWQERRCRQEFLYHAFKAVTFNGIAGDYAEFGCCGGMTFTLAHRESKRLRFQGKLYAFDSFQGLPSQSDSGDEHPAWQEGTMSTSLQLFHAICKFNGMAPSDYEVIPGFYNESLPKLGPEEGPRSIAIAYVDCDLYASTKSVLEFILPRIQHGTIIAFDDYFCCSATKPSGERRAMLEYFPSDARWALLPYINYGWHGASFMIEDKQLAG